MKLANPLLSTVLTFAGWAVVLCCGCEESQSARTTAAIRQVSPEDSFNEIAKQFAQSVQTGAGGMPGGFIEREPDGHSRLVIKNDVKHEFIKPKKEGDPYRGLITVTSKFDYSIQRIAGSNEEENERQEEAETGQGPQILDDNLVKRSGTSESRKSDTEPAEDLIARRSDEAESTYALEYEDDRWVLKTPLNPETEQAIENAFNHILSQQP